MNLNSSVKHAKAYAVKYIAYRKCMNMLPRVFTPKQMLQHVYLESSERLRPANGLEHWNGSFEYIAEVFLKPKIVHYAE